MHAGETTPRLEQRGSGYHLVCLGGIDPVQDALNSVQLGMEGLDALLCPLLCLERPQCLGGMETWSDGPEGQGKQGFLRWLRPSQAVVPGPPADISPSCPKLLSEPLGHHRPLPAQGTGTQLQERRGNSPAASFLLGMPGGLLLYTYETQGTDQDDCGVGRGWQCPELSLRVPLD